MRPNEFHNEPQSAHILSLQVADDTPAPVDKTEYVSYLERIHEYIRQNLYDPELSTDMITTHFGMSRAKLYRITESMGGIKRFIRQQRLKQAYQSLAGGNVKSGSVSNLAYDLGFGSENAFRRSFKESFGMAPTEAWNKRL